MCQGNKSKRAINETENTPKHADNTVATTDINVGGKTAKKNGKVAEIICN